MKEKTGGAENTIRSLKRFFQRTFYHRKGNKAMEERQRDSKGVFLPSHGMAHTPLHNKWMSMKERCNNPNCKSYKRYGAKGIKVCSEWEDSFQSFYDWSMASGYKEGLTIDRIDNSKGYSPDNCRWATSAEQNRNYSRNHLVTYNGKTQCIADWAKETGINRATILFRLQAGKPLETVFDKRDRRSLRWQKH